MRFNLGPFLTLKSLLIQTSEEKPDFSPFLAFFNTAVVEKPEGKHYSCYSYLLR